MGQRSRKRRRAETVGAPRPAPPPGARPAEDGAEPSRSERRAAEARARLQPLGPGERPTAVTVAAIVAALLALANLALFAAGVEVRGQKTSPVGVIVFAGVMGSAAVGMWRSRYWAVLGFQALLAVTVLIAALSLAVASNLAAVALCVVLVGLGGTLFWFLVKAMARIQMPER